MSQENKTIDNLKQIRDELKLKAHLFELETKEQWEGLEKKWQKINEDYESAREAAEEAAKDVNSAAGLLIDEISSGYNKIKKSIQK